jgi:hypothetical protein
MQLPAFLITFSYWVYSLFTSTVQEQPATQPASPQVEVVVHEEPVEVAPQEPVVVALMPEPEVPIVVLSSPQEPAIQLQSVAEPVVQAQAPLPVVQQTPQPIVVASVAAAKPVVVEKLKFDNPKPITKPKLEHVRRVGIKQSRKNKSHLTPTKSLLTFAEQQDANESISNIKHVDSFKLEKPVEKAVPPKKFMPAMGMQINLAQLQNAKGALRKH